MDLFPTLLGSMGETFLTSNDDGRSMGCEGWGNTPFAALKDLRAHMRTEHPDEFASIGEG